MGQYDFFLEYAKLGPCRGKGRETAIYPENKWLILEYRLGDPNKTYLSEYSVFAPTNCFNCCCSFVLA